MSKKEALKNKNVKASTCSMRVKAIVKNNSLLISVFQHRDTYNTSSVDMYERSYLWKQHLSFKRLPDCVPVASLDCNLRCLLQRLLRRAEHILTLQNITWLCFAIQHYGGSVTLISLDFTQKAEAI